MSQVTVYSRTVCKLCDKVKLKLKQAGVEFEIINLDLPEHSEARSYVENVIGAKSVPVVVSDVLPPILGYRPEKLKQLISALSSGAAGASAASSTQAHLTKNG